MSGIIPGAETEGRVRLLERSDRVRIMFSGAKAAESLTGLVTSDVLSLTPGRGQYSAALTPKGKVIADLRILSLGDRLLVDANAAAGPGFLAMIRKYVNPRLAKYADASMSLGDVGVFGEGALALLRSVLPDAVVPDDLPDFSHVEARIGDTGITVLRAPDYGVEGYDVFGEPAVLAELGQRLVAAGAVAGEPGEALQASRIAAGRPEWGVDMDDSMLAQEVDLDRLGAISFTKGCYTGQETVARVHYRGHVNRHLRGLRFQSGDAPPRGTELHDAEGKAAGMVLSAARSPRHGLVALALVRKEAESGSLVRATWLDRTAEAELVSLPFPS